MNIILLTDRWCHSTGIKLQNLLSMSRNSFFLMSHCMSIRKLPLFSLVLIHRYILEPPGVGLKPIKSVSSFLKVLVHFLQVEPRNEEKKYKASQSEFIKQLVFSIFSFGQLLSMKEWEPDICRSCAGKGKEKQIERNCSWIRVNQPSLKNIHLSLFFYPILLHGMVERRQFEHWKMTRFTWLSNNKWIK